MSGACYGVGVVFDIQKVVTYERTSCSGWLNVFCRDDYSKLYNSSYGQ